MATYERLDYGSPDGSRWGGSSSDKIGFYGVTPVAQRAYSSAVHLYSELSSSTDFTTAHLNAVNEIQKTLVASVILALP